MFNRTITTWRLAVMAPLALALSGCVLRPAGTDEERAKLDRVGTSFERPYEQRELPELPADPAWRDVLHRAFLANGDLEVAYFNWKAAVHRIDMAAAYPNTNLSLGFEYMFSSESMKSWDRTTVTAQPDPMANLAFPTKVKQAGRIALAEAQAAGERFRSAKFELQRQVLTAWTDYAAMAEQVRVARENLALLKLLAETADNRVRAGAPQQDLLKAQIELQMAENELGTMESRLPQMRAMLNAMLGRASDAPLPPPATLPAPRPLFGTDAELIEAAVDQNPELAALSRDVQGRRDALELARMRYIPDINPVAGFTGSIEQFVGAMVSIPTALPMIRAQTQEARADLRRMQAMQRQSKLERGAAFVSALYAMRNGERQITVFRDRILPAAELALDNSRQSYAAGSVSFVELIDSQRTLLEVRLMIAEAVAARERSLAELEALAGIDVETLESRSSTTVPATRGTEVHSHD